jgi:hypothetical protein
MTDKGKQVLLPPPSSGPDRPAGIFAWLTDPLPGNLMLPATGLLVLGLDWLLFPPEAATLGLSTPLAAIFGFLAGSMGTYHLQTRYAGDTGWKAWLKALAAGLVVGVPFPMAGTMVGAWILASSGLASWKNRLLNNSLVQQAVKRAR